MRLILWGQTVSDPQEVTVWCAVDLAVSFCKQQSVVQLISRQEPGDCCRAKCVP